MGVIQGSGFRNFKNPRNFRNFRNVILHIDFCKYWRTRRKIVETS